MHVITHGLEQQHRLLSWSLSARGLCSPSVLATLGKGAVRIIPVDSSFPCLSDESERPGRVLCVAPPFCRFGPSAPSSPGHSAGRQATLGSCWCWRCAGPPTGAGAAVGPQAWPGLAFPFFHFTFHSSLNLNQLDSLLFSTFAHRPFGLTRRPLPRSSSSLSHPPLPKSLLIVGGSP